MSALAVTRPVATRAFGARDADRECPPSPDQPCATGTPWRGTEAPRYGRLIVVVALHAVLFWGLWHSVVVRKVPQRVPVSLKMFLHHAEKPERPRPKTLEAPKPVPRVDRAPSEIPQIEVPILSGMVLPQATADPPAAPRVAASDTPAIAPRDSAPARVELPSTAADYLSNPAPAYPPASKRQREQGRVLLYVLVDIVGLPKKIELKSGSGFRRLDESAMAAVQQWKFVPGRRNGVPEEMWVELPVEFRLQG